MKIAVQVLSVLVLFCTSTTMQAQSGQRSAQGQDRLFSHNRVERAWEAAVAAKKPLLVMFTSDNCVYCKKMLAETYGHPAIKQMLVGRTESVMAHANDYGDLVQRMGIRGYPTSLLISPQGEVLDVMEGFVEPRAFAQRIKPLLASKATENSVPSHRKPVAQYSAGR